MRFCSRVRFRPLFLGFFNLMGFEIWQTDERKLVDRLKRFSRITRDSFSTATALFALIGTVATIVGVSVRQLLPGDLPIWITSALVVFVFGLTIILIYAIKWLRVRNGIRLNIRGNDVVVKSGDLFESEGWKIIPFNEFFDTSVDDIIISKTSLNGVFIEKHVDDVQKLKNDIVADSDSVLGEPSKTKEGKLKYELGTIKRYGSEYLILAFTHFNEHNEAHLSMADYERCLMMMWREIRRVYSGKPVYLPLLGSGITCFDDFGEKSYQDLLRCLICTLRSSKLNFTVPITIVLTKEVLKGIDLYELKEME